MTERSLFARPVQNEEPPTPPMPEDNEAPAANGTRDKDRPDRPAYSVDREAEVALLGAFLNGADPNLVANDVWTLPRAQAVHAACLRLDDGTRFPLDVRLVVAEVGPQLEDLTVHLPDVYATGTHALAVLAARSCSVPQAVEFAAIVTDHARRRELARIVDDATRALRAGDTQAALRAIEQATRPAETTGARSLTIEDIASIAARVDLMPPPQFIARPVWPADAYGIVGAESKAGKTWAAFDLAVAVASGGSWLGQFPCDAAGRVLVFLGEGGERKTIRRLRAVCDHYGKRLEDLPLRVCHRVPELTIAQHISEIRQELAARPAALVIVDPFYLAARGAKSSDLFGMAAVLEPVQAACQEHGAALVIVHHWNQTGSGKGKERFSGAGSEEWGRVLASVAVESRVTDEITKETRVTLEWHFVGDEIPDTEVRVLRSVRAVDPDDLGSAMEYTIAALDREQRVTGEEWSGPTECKAAILALFAESTIFELSKNGVQKELRDRGVRFQNRTISQAVEQLATEGKMKVRLGSRNARLFSLADGQTLEGVA